MTMFPLELRIERADWPSSFELPDNGSVFPLAPPPRYRVTATVLDTIEKTILSYEFFSMEVPGADPFESIGRVAITPAPKHLENLRELRDALNELLDERPCERCGKLRPLTYVPKYGANFCDQCAYEEEEERDD